MKNISVQLRIFVQDSLHPRILAGRRISLTEFEKWEIFVHQEIEILTMATLTFPTLSRHSKDSAAFCLIDEITELSNIVNAYLMKFAKVWQVNPSAGLIKSHYLFTCEAFETFLNSVAKKNPGIAGKTRYSDFAIGRIKPELRLKVNAVEFHLRHQQIGQDILTMLIGAFGQMISQKSLRRCDNTYLQKLLASLSKKTFGNSGDLSDFLIINDFNVPEFFLFCVATWNERLTEAEGLYDQRELLLEAKSHLYDLSLANGAKHPAVKQRLYTELNAFLTEKYALVKERIKINRQALVDTPDKKLSKRVLINLSVAQLGLFIRLQIEKGFLGKEHIGDLFAFYAKHFYTPNTDYISAESLQKKSTVVEHATAQKLKGHLISMLNWLNTNYNLSNFN